MNKQNIIVVSLFDGLSGGRLATDLCNNLNVLRYYSSEVDSYAIQVADYNYPQDTQYRLGDVAQINFEQLLTNIQLDFPGIPILLLGGSPCQGFSMAGRLKGSSTKCGKNVTTYKQYMTLKEMDFEFDGQSYLFWEYIRAMKILNPDYFMLENVKISKKWLPMFNKTMGVEPIVIDSALVSFQHRVRFYWTNIPNIVQPEDNQVYLRDNYCKLYDNSLILKGRGLNKLSKPRNRAKHVTIDKCPTLLREQCSKATDSLVFYMPNGTPRYPTRREMELMQTVPEGYTSCVPYNDAAAMLGNGWTIKVPAHILSFI